MAAPATERNTTEKGKQEMKKALGALVRILDKEGVGWYVEGELRRILKAIQEA